MRINVKEHTIEEINEKLKEMNTELNKISYLESVIKERGFSFEVKRFILGKLAVLYEERKMYDKAAKIFSNKAQIEISNKDKVESFLKSAELYSKAGKIDDADNIFSQAIRNVDAPNKIRIQLAKKNIYTVFASELENKGKKASAVKFYEKLIKMPLENDEKIEILEKLKETYNSLGMFREAKLLEGIK